MSNTYSYQIEVSEGTLDNDPFFSTQSPHPFSISVGDEIAGDARVRLQNLQPLTGPIRVVGPIRIVVVAVRHDLFFSTGTLPTRNLRVAVELTKGSTD